MYAEGLHLHLRRTRYRENSHVDRFGVSKYQEIDPNTIIFIFKIFPIVKQTKEGGGK